MIKLFKGDCLKVMDYLISKDIKVDAIITDPPYGTTVCKWDSVVSLDEMWERLKLLIKDNGAVLLFGLEPFASMLRLSNLKMYKYDLYWQKERITNILQVKKRAGKNIEIISIFYNKQPTYNPQKNVYTGKLRTNKVRDGKLGYLLDSNRKKVFEYKDDGTRYPTQLLKFSRDCMRSRLHPTQKPLNLIEYLVKTYTNEGDLVLDFTMGSGTTGCSM